MYCVASGNATADRGLYELWHCLTALKVTENYQIHMVVHMCADSTLNNQYPISICELPTALKLYH